ncbi:MAG: peptidoglycan-binding protein, partial [Thermoleophilia bacterium]|nr:peptidoglycan-binding protein [Thermoleophilia bacterium]
ALGLISGLLARRRARANGTLVAAQQQSQAIAPGAGVAPNIIPQSVGKTIRVRSSGSPGKTMQRNLKTLGLWPGKITGKFDTKLASAIKSYELMKGVQPTGESSNEMRVALIQDAALKGRFA